MGAGLSCAMNTCARAECDGREHVVDYVDHDRTLPDTPDVSMMTENADSSYFQMDQSTMSMPGWDHQAVGFAAQPPMAMHPGMGPGGVGGSFMLPASPTHDMYQMRQTPGLLPASGASFAALQPRMPPGHIVPGPGWQHQHAVLGRNVPSYPGKPLDNSRVKSQGSPAQPQLSHTGSVVSSRAPWEESSNQAPSPIPTQLVEELPEASLKPVGSCHRLQSVPKIPAGLRTPVPSHRGPKPAGLLQGEPKPHGFQVIATVADFELGFDLFGAKIRDAALAAGHTSETMDNKFVSITDSYGRVFNWNRPLDFEPTVDMFPLMYRYTPPEENSVGTGTMGTGALGTARSALGSHSNVQHMGLGDKSLPNTARRPVASGTENKQSTTLPMVMMAY